MLGSFAEIDIVFDKKPVDDPRSFEQWYIELLLKQLSHVEDYDVNIKDYLRYQIIQNFNQNFLGWESYKKDSPMDVVLLRKEDTPIRRKYSLGSDSELLFLMARYNEILNTFGITYTDLKNMTVAETNILRKVLELMRTKEEGD